MRTEESEQKIFKPEMPEATNRIDRKDDDFRSFQPEAWWERIISNRHWESFIFRRQGLFIISNKLCRKSMSNLSKFLWQIWRWWYRTFWKSRLRFAHLLQHLQLQQWLANFPLLSLHNHFSSESNSQNLSSTEAHSCIRAPRSLRKNDDSPNSGRRTRPAWPCFSSHSTTNFWPFWPPSLSSGKTPPKPRSWPAPTRQSGWRRCPPRCSSWARSFWWFLIGPNTLCFRTTICSSALPIRLYPLIEARLNLLDLPTLKRIKRDYGNCIAVK